MGHIELAAPVTHIWYFKGVPSRLGYLLNLAPKDLEKVIYFAAYMITEVDEKGRHDDLPELRAELEVQEEAALSSSRDADDRTTAPSSVEVRTWPPLEADGAKRRPSASKLRKQG